MWTEAYPEASAWLRPQEFSPKQREEMLLGLETMPRVLTDALKPKPPLDGVLVFMIVSAQYADGSWFDAEPVYRDLLKKYVTLDSKAPTDRN
jgi:hypothetical protein